MTALEVAASQAHPVTAGRPRVLVADAEDQVRQILAQVLPRYGIHADTVADGRQAVAMAAPGHYDLVILDLMMPGQNGFSALRQIMRDRPDQPVLVLSARSDPESKVAGLGLGADDYLPKPFHVGELVARVQARLRAAARPGPGVLVCGRLRLDTVHRYGDAGAGPVPLTSREFQLLFELMRRPGTVVPKRELVTRLWGTPPGTTSNVVDVCVHRLRTRLGTDAITTVRGEGYRVGPG
jgi:DNA-binding response OmpR family regulator